MPGPAQATPGGRQGFLSGLVVLLIRFVITVGHASGVTWGIGQEPFVVNDNPRPTGGGTYKKE
jgi:hypothetical protein